MYALLASFIDNLSSWQTPGMRSFRPGNVFSDIPMNFSDASSARLIEDSSSILLVSQ
jgi:hypothetical protein